MKLKAGQDFKTQIAEVYGDDIAGKLYPITDDVTGQEAFLKSDFFTLKKGKGDTFEIIASTPDVDRDHEIIEPHAFSNLDTYLKYNPVVLYAHDHYNQPPIGKAVAGSITDQGLMLTIEFAPTPFAQEIKSLYEGGFMNTFSVGFIPIEMEPNENGIWVFKKVELLEVSAVSVPANANARIRRAYEGACAKGITLPNIDSLINEETKAGRSKPEPKGESAEKAVALSLADRYINTGD